jgi:prevent-host-death family protein
MPTQTVNLDKVEKQLAELLAIVKPGSEIVLAQNGKPIARLASVARTQKKRSAGLNRGTIWTSDDFDAALPDEFWLGTK